MNALLLAALASIAPPEVIQHEFAFVAPPETRRVNLAGTFNGWSRDATPMVRKEGNRWSVTLPLESGKHLYKFVLDGDRWELDPANPKQETDVSGHTNSVLLLFPRDFAQPAQVGDGRITASALRHRPQKPELHADGNRLYVQFRTRPGDVQRVDVVSSLGETSMVKGTGDEFHVNWRTEVSWNPAQPFRYRFRVRDGARVMWVGAEGTSARPAGQAFTLTPQNFRPLQPPAWVERSIMYQIFPDRFLNGDPTNDPAHVVPWDGTPTYFNWFGGDLAGVRQQRPYLRDLNVSLIYFNPIFLTPSNHGYETIDYLKVHTSFGTNELFATLTRELEQDGIRVVLDGVFNHSATTFPPFADLVAQGEQSRYRDWFFPKSFPVRVGDPPNYEAWFGFPSMPKVNLMNPEAREFMLRVPEFWHQNARIAGWRLDVANEVPMDFWRVFRTRTKALDPDKWILGEVWGDGAQWLQGDQWDSVMNYPFRETALGFLAQQTLEPSQAWARLENWYWHYGPAVSRNLMNLLGSHDTPRFLTLAGGDRYRAKLGATLLMTWVGVPSIYYGDELGMEGYRDPENRRGMRWDLNTPDNAMLAHYRALTEIRSTNRPLQSGRPVLLLANDAQDVLAFGRVLGHDHTLVLLNRSDQPRTIRLSGLRAKVGALMPMYRDAISGRIVRPDADSLSITLGPRTSAVLARPEPTTSATSTELRTQG